MKRCPECRRDYTDGTLSYCLDDGTPLLEGPADDDAATRILLADNIRSDVPATRDVHDRVSAKSPTLNTGNKVVLAAAFAIPVLITLLVGGYLYLKRDPAALIESIAVMPLVNESGNPELEYLSDGITESLINSLSKLPTLKVKARDTVFRYKGADVIKEGAAKELAVQAVLVGRITQRADDLSLFLELIDAGTGDSLWSEDYNRKLKDLPALQTEITRDVSRKLRSRLSTADAKQLTSNYSENSDAYQDYLKGRYLWGRRTPESIRRAIDYFNQAIEKDPNYARAYAGLADAYVVPASRMAPRDAMPKAKAAAMRALELDDTLAEAHTSLARVLQVYEWNWSEAEKEFKRAIELDPRYPVAHQWYGGYLERTGNIAEAINERKLALELDPLSTITNFELAQSYYFSRDYDKALRQLAATLELDPTFPAAIQYLPAVYVQKGMFEEAIASINAAQPGAAIGETGTPGYVYAVAGRKAEAIAAVEELLSLRKQQYVSAVSIALVYVGLGKKDEALSWLEKGYEERAFQMQALTVEPRWDSIRSDPRFAALRRRIGLPEK